jgi:predicted nucleic acid-binding protein
MNDKVFVDTNILLYARDSAQPAKQRVAEGWIQGLWRKRTGRLSYQVLQEFYVNATQKLRPGMPVDLARQDVHNLSAWHPISTDAALIESAWGLVDRHGFSWRDAQIVAAARRSECNILLSEDMQHGLDVNGTRIINPFAEDAAPAN